MQCPIDGTQLVMADRQGIEIDYCPQCRGVWLDRGELDKIIERSVPAVQPAAPPPPPRAYRGDDRDRERAYRDDDRDDDRRGRRKSLLGEIFDF
jgi:hypothetical protein